MSLYAESSAVLAWLLNEPQAPAVRQELLQAPLVATSALTWVECDRALRRYAALAGRPPQGLEAGRQRMLELADAWTRFEIDSACLEAACRDFPAEPVRALDALHLATATVARREIPDLRILSLDDRLRTNAAHLGFQVLP